jgi:hypothetical protein
MNIRTEHSSDGTLKTFGFYLEDYQYVLDVQPAEWRGTITFTRHYQESDPALVDKRLEAWREIISQLPHGPRPLTDCGFCAATSSPERRVIAGPTFGLCETCIAVYAKRLDVAPRHVVRDSPIPPAAAPLDQEQIQAMERGLGIMLPSAYLSFLKTVPVQNAEAAIAFENWSRLLVAPHWLELTRMMGIEGQTELIWKIREHHLLPIADDSSGEQFLCLELRAPHRLQRVVPAWKDLSEAEIVSSLGHFIESVRLGAAG